MTPQEARVLAEKIVEGANCTYHQFTKRLASDVVRVFSPSFQDDVVEYARKMVDDSYFNVESRSLARFVLDHLGLKSYQEEFEEAWAKIAGTPYDKLTGEDRKKAIVAYVNKK